MDSTHMSALGRSGTLALCAAVALTGVLRAPRTAATLAVPVAENSATHGRTTPPEAEMVVSLGRFSLLWPEETGALYWELRKLAVEFCFCASALRTVDDMTCRSAFEHHVRLEVVRRARQAA